MVLRNLVQLKSIAKEAIDRTVIVAKFLCFLHVTNTYICSPALVYGPSMLPTFNLTGDLVLSERISTRLGKVKHGDIVLVLSPENPKKTVTKRIVGMEGDKVTYLVDPKNTEISNTVMVPKGHVWIQGDNMYASNDSQHFGAVPYGLLKGKVFCRDSEYSSDSIYKETEASNEANVHKCSAQGVKGVEKIISNRIEDTIQISML